MTPEQTRELEMKHGKKMGSPCSLCGLDPGPGIDFTWAEMWLTETCKPLLLGRVHRACMLEMRQLLHGMSADERREAEERLRDRINSGGS